MSEIHLWGVKQNNLKNIEVRIPLGSFTVVCGPSGSGKSSLAFETLFAEGQRRYIESLSNYARQFLGKAPKPDIEGIENIPPSIAIEQKNTVKTSRSTVGTTTEVVDYLRLLYEKIGEVRCPTFDFAIRKESPAEAVDRSLKEAEGDRAYLLAPVFCDQLVAKGQKLLQILLQDGYRRLYVPPTRRAASKIKSAHPLTPCIEEPKKGRIGEIIELTPKTKVGDLPKRDFFIVVDRVALTQDNRGRLIDSISQCYEISLKLNRSLFGGRAQVLTTDGRQISFSEDQACSVCGFVFPQMNSRLFSFNNALGACPTCNGFGNILDLDPEKIIPNPDASLKDGALHPFTMPSASHDRRLLLSYCKKKKIPVEKPWSQLTEKQRETLWNGDSQFFGVKGLFEYLETKKYKMHVRVFLSRYKSAFECPDCKGTRLRPDIDLVKINGYTIKDLSSMTIGKLAETINSFQLTPMQEEIAGEVLEQIRSRLKFLLDVGVYYLTMDRPTKTLSGGEFQRLILAKQLGMGLSQTLYVLDEPTIGLHPRDNDRLIGLLHSLKDLGNTLVVVEHDRDVIERSTHLIELGPGSGFRGGEIVFAGPTRDFYKAKHSATLPYILRERQNVPMSSHRAVDIETYKYKLSLKGCRGFNLKNIDVTFPLNRLVTVTGVSGSGKSTLVSKTLYPALARKLGLEYIPAQPYSELTGAEHVHNIVLIDQSPIGKTARSNPMTYLKIFDPIRELLASTREAKVRGYTPGTFSLNVEGGRCPTCKGLGVEVIDMLFMDDVEIPCEVCDGKRYKEEILDIRYNGRNILDILNMTVQEAMDFFVAYPQIRKPLSFLKEVGLDYIQLGQSANTFSGGESQRLKIARELLRTKHRATLYILDEPTTGLHFREIDMLLKVLHRLIDSGGSVILVEHNLEVIHRSDYIIDIGPEAGEGGGHIVAQGSPMEIIQTPNSHTGRYLKDYVFKHYNMPQSLTDTRLETPPN